MLRSKLWAGLLVGCLVAVMAWAAPASADTDFMVGTIDTHVPTSCAVAGTGVAPQSTGVSNVSYTYSGNDEGPNTIACAGAIFAFMVQEAGQTGTAVQQLQGDLFSGDPNLHSPYQVFLNNMYISIIILDGLTPTAPNSAEGLGSCSLTEFLTIDCKDDSTGKAVARDQYGNIIYVLGQPLYVPLQGVMSQNGGTTLGSVFIENTDVQGPDRPAIWPPNSYCGQAFVDCRVLHHEQVHSQQWAKYGWNFASMYASQYVNAAGNAQYYSLLYGPVDTIKVVPAWCFVNFERNAGFQDGHYAVRDTAHGGTFPVGTVYPLKNGVPSTTDQWGNYRPCPATWN